MTLSRDGLAGPGLPGGPRNQYVIPPGMVRSQALNPRLMGVVLYAHRGRTRLYSAASRHSSD